VPGLVESWHRLLVHSVLDEGDGLSLQVILAIQILVEVLLAISYFWLVVLDLSLLDMCVVVFNFVEVHLVSWSLVIILVIVGSGSSQSRRWIRELDEHVLEERVLAMACQMLLAILRVLSSQLTMPVVRRVQLLPVDIHIVRGLWLSILLAFTFSSHIDLVAATNPLAFA